MRYFHVVIGLLTLFISALFTVPKALAIDHSPKHLTFFAIEGGSNPSSQGVIVSKSPQRNMNWATSYTPLWLRVTLSPWHVVPSDQLLVSVEVAGLAAGVYRGTVRIAAPKGASISIPVTLRIAPRRPSLSATLTPITNNDDESDGLLTSAPPH